MPIVVVYGIPEQAKPVQIKSLRADLAFAVASIEELGVQPSGVYVYPLKEMQDFGFSSGLGAISAVVQLYQNEKRTRGVLEKVAKRVVETIKRREFADFKKVGCDIQFLAGISYEEE
ncbi:MAG: hypothetical protein HY445_02295 [Candidatus Niyogibacteria bacterium]|nr:hypothetical protein [Candidatus Niyogibacteria bacterium]